MGRLFMLIAVLLALLLVAPAAAVAQDATPAASPAAGPCDAPALPPGTPTPQEPEASPMAGMEMGTPDAVEAAEEIAETAEATEPAAPPATPMPAGTPADQATADEAIAAVENVVNCANAGNAEAVVALLTTNFLETEFGTGNPYDLLAELPLVPGTVESLGDVQTHDDGRVSADVVYTGLFFTPNMLSHERWYLIEEEGYWKVDGVVELPIEAEGATVVEAEMLDYAFNLSQTSAPAGGPIVFKVRNGGQYPHELVVMRLPEGITADQLLEDESLFEQVQFFGVTFAEGGQQAEDFAMVNLEPGTYTIVCFVDVPEGVPHIARGMVHEFTIE
jgi:hypothetical protein